MLGNAIHTLVMVPAMINVLRPVALTAATKSGLSHALISPLRATYFACGAYLNLGDQRAVWTLWHGCGCDDGDLGQGRDLGERRGVGEQYRHLHVLDGLEQAALMIDQKQHGIAGIDDRSLPVEIGDVVHCVDDEVLLHA
jgi:hypothetical protein